jgi:hypothetical protein
MAIALRLCIRTFQATSANTLKTQFWKFISIFVLVAIIKKQLKPKQSLYTILQIVSVALFE